MVAPKHSRLESLNPFIFRGIVVSQGPLISIVHVFMLSEPKTPKIKVQHSSYFRISFDF